MFTPSWMPQKSLVEITYEWRGHPSSAIASPMIRSRLATGVGLGVVEEVHAALVRRRRGTRPRRRCRAGRRTTPTTRTRGRSPGGRTGPTVDTAFVMAHVRGSRDTTLRCCMDLSSDRRRARATRRVPGLAARAPAVGVRQGACRRASTTWPTRSRSAGNGRRSSRPAGGSASRGPRSTAGATRGPVGHYIVTEELARARAPELVGRIGVNLVGPTLLARGTSEQQARWLPKILRAEELWCQLFSEPNAGSDLSSLTTRATTHRRRVAAQRPEGVDELRAVRRLGRLPRPHRPRRAEEQGHLVPRRRHARTPGVEVRPLRQITDETDFNEVFFSDVFVPEDRIIGEENEGWQVANSDADPRAGRQPAPAGDPHAARRGAAAARRRERCARRPPQRAAARGGVRRGADLPAPQLAFDLAHREGRGTGAGRQHQQGLVERDEQAAPRHRDDGARAGGAAVAGRDREPRRRARGSARGSTTRRPRSGRGRTRSSATSSASARSASPASPSPRGEQE